MKILKTWHEPQISDKAKAKIKEEIEPIFYSSFNSVYSFDEVYGLDLEPKDFEVLSLGVGKNIDYLELS